MSDAQKTEIAEAKGKALGSIEFDGKTFPIARKPNALLLSELARTGSGDPEAFGVIAEFLSVTLGPDTYRDFKKAYYASDVADDEGVLMAKLQEILEATMGRPTE